MGDSILMWWQLKGPLLTARHLVRELGKHSVLGCFTISLACAYGKRVAFTRPPRAARITDQ